MSEENTAEEVPKTPETSENADIAPAGDETSIETPETETPESTPAKDEGKSTKGQTSRFIKKLSKRATKAEGETKEPRAEVEELKKRLGPTPEPVRPDRDSYDTDTEYEDALFDWRDEVKAAEAEPDTAPEVKGKTELETAFESELDEISPDAALLVLEDDSWPCTPDMFSYIVASDNRAQLAYHLASNPDISEKISKMTPILAARELAKVEATIASDTTSAESLPPPMDTGKPSSVGLSDNDKKSTAQWVADRRAGRI